AAARPDVGSAVCVGIVMTLIVVVAGARLRHLVLGVFAAGGCVAYYAMTQTGHVQRRLTEWGTGYQITQSIIALGSGSWTGVGLGRGTSKLYFLPEAHSDFIFPVI